MSRDHLDDVEALHEKCKLCRFVGAAMAKPSNDVAAVEAPRLEHQVIVNVVWSYLISGTLRLMLFACLY